MNSTSAFDHFGGVPFVEGGSVRLGLPGAPGCTTTGFAESACFARAGEEKKPVAALAARSMPHTTADPLAEWRLRLRSRRTRQSFHFGASLDIFSPLTLKGSSKGLDGETRLAPLKFPRILAEPGGQTYHKEPHLTAHQM
jgi:hypothetical protein